MDETSVYTISDKQDSKSLAVGDTNMTDSIDQKQLLRVEDKTQLMKQDLLLKSTTEALETLLHLQKKLESVTLYLNDLNKSPDSTMAPVNDGMETRLMNSFDCINTANKYLESILPDVHVNESPSANVEEVKHQDPLLKNDYNFLMTGKINKIQDLLTNMIPIGHGGEGRVFRGKLRGNGIPVVVKSYFLDCEQSSRIEFAIMTLARNVQGVKMPIALVNTPTNFFLVMRDELNTTPLDTFVTNQKLTDLQIQCVFSQMVRILHDLNEKFIKHRDIKLENFLVNIKTGRLSIIDFGWSMYSAIDLVSIDEVRRTGETLMGTTDYLPPENNSPVGTIVSYEKACVYALGCILFELFFGFQGRLNKIMPPTGIAPLIATISNKTGRRMPKGAHSLLDKCTRTNMSERLTLQGILNHPWVPSDRQNLKQNNRYTFSSSKQKIKSYEL